MLVASYSVIALELGETAACVSANRGSVEGTGKGLETSPQLTLVVDAASPHAARAVRAERRPALILAGRLSEWVTWDFEDLVQTSRE